MTPIIFWTLAYSIVVAASIIFLGNPSTLVGDLSLKSLLKLLLDWRFLLGGILALGARFIFVIINNLASKQPHLADAHLSITALATTVSIVVVLLANHLLLHDQLRPIQLVGAGIMIFGIFLVFR
jgi:drug/metabolite transporter (DMT)-like permease